MREIYLDIAKGISILLVILGHIIQYTSLNNSFLNNEIWIFIYSFHVPLFMHISGQLLFKSLQKNKKNIISCKIKQLLTPVIVWGVIIVSLYIILYTVTKKECFYPNLHKELVMSHWFFKTLLCCSLILILSHQLSILYKTIIPIILIGLIILALPYNIFFVKSMYPFVLLGYLERKFNLIPKIYKNRYSIPILIIYICTIFFYKGEYTIYFPNNNIIALYRFFLATPGIHSILYICFLCSHKENYFTHQLSYIGTVTGALYILQYFFIEHIYIWLGFTIDNEILLNIIAPIITIIATYLLLYINMTIKNKHLRVLLFGY